MEKSYQKISLLGERRDSASLTEIGRALSEFGRVLLF